MNLKKFAPEQSKVMRLSSFTILLFAFSFLLSVFCSAQTQPGYDLKFKIQGWQDTTTYLGYYYGETTYIKDTAQVNGKGEFHFDGKKNLSPGVYFLVLNKAKVNFEFLVSQSQRFTMETKADEYVKNMKVTGDNDNKIFFENMVFNMERHKEAEPFMKVIQDSSQTEDQKKEARAAFAKVNEKVIAYQNEIIAKHPGTLTAAITKANQAIKIPEPPKKPDGSIDSSFQLRWYREHYFDNFDLSNEALLRLPRPMYR